MEYSESVEQRLEEGESAGEEELQLQESRKRVAQIVYQDGRPKLIDDHYLFYYEDTCEEFTIPADSIKDFVNGPPVKWHDDDNNQIIELSFSNAADETAFDNSEKEKKKSYKNPPTNGKMQPSTWGQDGTRILIDSFRTRRIDLLNGTLRKTKELWEAIGDDLSAGGYYYTTTQIENRWKTLERSYRKMMDHNARYKIKKQMPFADELKDLVRPRTKENDTMGYSSQDDDRTGSPEIRYELSYPADVKPVTAALNNYQELSNEGGNQSLSSVLTELQKLRQEINNKEAGIRRRHEEKMNLIREHNTIEKRKADLFEKYLQLQTGTEVVQEEETETVLS